MLKTGIDFFKKHWLILIIIILGFSLRAYRYPQFPIAGETADEIAWSMLGASWLQTGRPASWSWFDAYQNHVVGYVSNNPAQVDDQFGYRLVSPAVDHPPLFAFIPGFFHSLRGVWNEVPSIKLIRLPMIFLGTFNLWLLYLVAQKVFKKKSIAYLASLLYAVIPTVVFSSRLVVAENLLITWMLLAIYLIKAEFKQKKLLLILVSIGAVLTKVAGIIIPLGIIFYGWENKKSLLLKSGIIGLILGELGYLLYGVLLNWKLFLEVNLSQAGRDLGLTTLLNRLFLHPAVVEKLFFDGWIWLGLIALVGLSLVKLRKYSIVKIYAFLWLAFIAATTGENTFHAWYDYPLYPLLVLAIAWFLHYLYQNKLYWLGWLSWLVVLPSIKLALVFSNQSYVLSNLVLREVMILGALPLGLSLFGKNKLAQKSMIFLGVILLIAGVTIVLTINERAYWELSQKI